MAKKVVKPMQKPTPMSKGNQTPIKDGCGKKK